MTYHSSRPLSLFPSSFRYHIHGLDSVSANGHQTDYTKIYFDGAPTSLNVIVDDVSVKLLPQQCNNLIENPSFEQGSAFWLQTDENKDRVKLSLYPGAGGEGDFALRAHARDHRWRGIMQKLDARCFVPGEELTITAKFKLLNATDGQGLGCDVNDQRSTDDNCPHVMIKGRTCSLGNDIYWRFWNTNSEWDKDSFNDFR